MNIKETITIDELKFLTTKDNAEKVLQELGVPYRKNKIWETLLRNYDYNEYLKIFRKIAISDGGKYDTKEIPKLLERRETLISINT